jgi:putative heme-binding domain-containing protein
VFRELSGDASFAGSDRAGEILRELAVMAAESGDIPAIAAVLDALGHESTRIAGGRRPFLQAMLTRGGPATRQALVASSDARIREEINGIVAAARAVAFDPQRPVSARIAQIPVLELVPFTDVRTGLRTLLGPDQHRNLQQAALALLARFEAPEVGALVVEVWPGLSPALRAQAADVLLARPAWALACITALETGRLTRGELGSIRIDALRKHADPSVRSRAREIPGARGAEVRGAVVARYRSALDANGDPAAGRAIFARVCAGCHGQDAAAGPLGPNLTGIGRIGREPLLLNILDPNRDVKAEYVTYTLETTAGTTHAGMIQHESANSVTLRRMDGSGIDILRVDIARLSALGVSFMPEGLEEQIPVPEMAHLLSYLESLR